MTLCRKCLWNPDPLPPDPDRARSLAIVDLYNEEMEDRLRVARGLHDCITYVRARARLYRLDQ